MRQLRSSPGRSVRICDDCFFPGLHSSVDVVAEAAKIKVTQAHLPTGGKGIGPPGLSPHPSFALPVLLGHLLL